MVLKDNIFKNIQNGLFSNIASIGGILSAVGSLGQALNLAVGGASLSYYEHLPSLSGDLKMTLIPKNIQEFLKYPCGKPIAEHREGAHAH